MGWFSNSEENNRKFNSIVEITNKHVEKSAEHNNSVFYVLLVLVLLILVILVIIIVKACNKITKRQARRVVRENRV